MRKKQLFVTMQEAKLNL